MVARAVKQVTATGDVVTAGGPWYLHSVVLTPAAAVATPAVRDSASGAVLFSLQAAANGNSATWVAGDRGGVQFSSSIHATVSGASASAAFCYS